ncbi:MAG: lamin tail domain-containing protein [Flavobacteriales bacterium]|nr:lamin tail domain-containing protein [Flavobacteriales bacterium]
MKGLLLFGLFFLPILSNAQVKMDFNSPEWTQGWSGDLDKFTVVSGFLQSNSPKMNDTFSVFYSYELPSDWQIQIKCFLDFNTSSANYIDIFLPCKGDTSYLIRLGGSADELALWRSTPNPEKITSTAQGTTERSSWMLDILPDSVGTLFIRAQNTMTNISYDLNASLIVTPTGLGIQIRQSTASFFNRHRFDDVYLGPRIIDRQAPYIIDVRLTDHALMAIRLSEQPDSVLSARFCKVSGQDCGLQFTNSDALLVILPKADLSNNSNIPVELTDIFDRSGNALDTLFYFHYLYGDMPGPGDLIFTEILPDPSPVIALPEAEFVEITNVTERYISTLDLQFRDAGSSASLRETIMPPGSSLILCRDTDTSQFAPYGATLGLLNWPSLNNSSDDLQLINPDGDLIDSLSYNTGARSGTYKFEGGWSFELGDRTHACLGFEAWDYSVDPQGGSPGHFDPDPNYHHPRILEVNAWEWLGDRDILINLNGTLEPQSQPEHCRLQFPNSMVYPQSASRGNKLLIQLPTAPDRGVPLELYLRLSDCSGRDLDTNFIIGIPAPPIPGQLFLSEILFNPVSGGSDFIEIYNLSDLLLDASELFVFSKDSTAALEHYKPLTIERTLLPPRSFTAFSSSPNWARAYYQVPDSSRIIHCKYLPSLPDKTGNVGLANVQGEVLDHFEYSEDMHSLLLKTTEGVSLERVDLQLKTTNRGIWKSAASNVRFATPGYPNSRSLPPSPNIRCTITPKEFSPNNDGLSDYLRITWNSDARSDVSLHVEVFDRMGKFITRIREGELAGDEEIILWDGTTSEGEPLETGDYIIWIMARFADGTIHRQKAPVLLLR